MQFNSADAAKIRGLKTSDIEGVLGVRDYEEIVHRDDMVFL